MAQYVDVEKYLNDNFCDEFDECVSDEDCFVCWARRHTKDVAPVIHAEWFKSNHDFICTNCGVHSKDYHNYCPNCGARMKRSD